MATIHHDLQPVIAMLDEKITQLKGNMTRVQAESAMWKDMDLKLKETEKARKILFDCCCGTQNCGWNADSPSQAS